jgi:hypothetical protein
MPDWQVTFAIDFHLTAYTAEEAEAVAAGILTDVTVKGITFSEAVQQRDSEDIHGVRLRLRLLSETPPRQPAD